MIDVAEQETNTGVPTVRMEAIEFPQIHQYDLQLAFILALMFDGKTPEQLIRETRERFGKE